MDPTRILEADHREIEELFAHIEALSGDERVPHVERLLTVLRAHMTLEEEVVYPAIAKVTGADSEVENRNEHSVARANLDEAESFLGGEPGLGAAMAAAQAAVSHHVEEEESDVFPKAREHGREVLDRMLPSFVSRRLELGMPVDGDALAAALSTEELRQHADRLDIDSEGHMQHDQLAHQISAKLAG
jgi:hemerythrin superfamily protein